MHHKSDAMSDREESISQRREKILEKPMKKFTLGKIWLNMMLI